MLLTVDEVNTLAAIAAERNVPVVYSRERPGTPMVEFLPSPSHVSVRCIDGVATVVVCVDDPADARFPHIELALFSVLSLAGGGDGGCGATDDFLRGVYNQEQEVASRFDGECAEWVRRTAAQLVADLEK